tara:strand:+ start:7145 stop:8398 length:1254 start_codon:yes stop_codon:yes gene_type:complete
MAIVSPFRAVRPVAQFAAKVSAPPYDVVSLEEACDIAKDNPYSFLRVSRAELELSPEVNSYSPSVYERGAQNLQNLISNGILTREEQPVLGVYRQRWETHQQTGLVALASVDEYDRGIIKKHELTRPAKEADRVRIIHTHESQSGPVLLFFRRPETFNDWLEWVTSTPPDLHFIADDNVEHTVWIVRDEPAIRQVVESFLSIETMYIADGHHRSAAASRVRAARRNATVTPTNTNEEGFLAVIFPHDALRVLPYNRVVRDLNGLTPTQFIKKLSVHFELQLTLQPSNPPPAGFDMYIKNQWHRATPKHLENLSSGNGHDPIRSLAVSVLTELVLDPLLGIMDQRSDPRIDFVGGVRGVDQLTKMVDHGDWSVAFWLYPTTVDELMAVSDAELIMPPKSTWFEPKLRDGLFIHMLRDD